MLLAERDHEFASHFLVCNIKKPIVPIMCVCGESVNSFVYSEVPLRYTREAKNTGNFGFLANLTLVFPIVSQNALAR